MRAGPRARLADHRRRRKLAAVLERATMPAPPAAFRAFGPGSVIAPPARIDAPQWVAVGRDTVIHEHVFLTSTHQPGRPEPLLEIGDRVRIGRFCQISVTGHMIIEDDVLISDEVHVGDTHHRYDEPGVGAQDQPLTDPGAVRIARGALVNFGAVVLQGVTVGEGVYVHAGAVVTRDVPAGTAVVGAPARPVEAGAGVWA
jgi:acetyltransferase-like isoleucine patch superfamily enzyme